MWTEHVDSDATTVSHCNWERDTAASPRLNLSFPDGQPLSHFLDDINGQRLGDSSPTLHSSFPHGQRISDSLDDWASLNSSFSDGQHLSDFRDDDEDDDVK